MVSLSWVLLSVMGAVPFVLSGYISNPIDALFGDGIGLYDDRCKYSEQCGAAAEMLIILAEFYALDRRYGRSGIPSECPADGGRFPYEFDEGGRAQDRS